jgi:hypothetical protein
MLRLHFSAYFDCFPMLGQAVAIEKAARRHHLPVFGAGDSGKLLGGLIKNCESIAESHILAG